MKRELRLELQGLLLITRGAQSANIGKNLVSATLTRRIHSNIYKCKECITQQIQEIHLQAHNSDWKDKNEHSLHFKSDASKTTSLVYDKPFSKSNQTNLSQILSAMQQCPKDAAQFKLLTKTLLLSNIWSLLNTRRDFQGEKSTSSFVNKH